MKEYRRFLSSQSFPTIEEYASEFIEFLPSLWSHVTRQDENESIYRRIDWEFRALRKAIQSAVDREKPNSLSLSDEEVIACITDMVDLRTARLRDNRPTEGLSASLAGQQISRVIDDWSGFVNRRLHGFPVTRVIWQKLRTMIRTSLRTPHEWPGSSGVVVAGFGTSQIFPALSCYLVDGISNGTVRSRERFEAVRIGDTHTALVRAFAQEDMVATFMNGINPNYHLALDGFVGETLRIFADHLSDRFEELLDTTAHSVLMDELDAARHEAVEHFRDELSGLLGQESWQPIMTIVEHLPKEELTEMAEALVNLTSFKRRVTPEAETVGGPVDVAVISKGDGLVWMKRKHYFSPDLNFRYFQQNQRPTELSKGDRL